MNDARPDVLVLGDVSSLDLPKCAAADLPEEAAMVVVPLPAASAAMVAEVRERCPRAQLVAWLESPAAPTADQCVAMGFDSIALSSSHLAKMSVICRQQVELRTRETEQKELHAGLVSLIHEINDRPDLSDTLRTAVLRLATLFDVERVSVAMFTPEEDVAFIVAEQEESLVDNIVIRLKDYPELQAVIKSREPLVIADVLTDSLLTGVRRKIEQAKSPPRAAVLFPLLHKGAVIGALFLRDREPMAQPPERLLEMGRLVASVTSIAIGSAVAKDSLESERRHLLRTQAETHEKLAGLQAFSDFLAQANDGIVITDQQGKIRYANAAAGAILRRTAGDLQGKGFIDLLSSRSHVLAERSIRGDRVGDVYGYVDLLVPLEEGQDIVISAAIRSLSQPDGVMISFRDVTELREIETELRQTKDFLENLIQSSVDAIVAADVNGRIILFNRAAEKLLGYTARDLVGKVHVSKLYLPGEAADVMRRLRSEAFGGRGRLETTRRELVAKDGELVPVSLTAAIIYEGDREVATVGVFTDLRERLKMEEKFTQVQRKLQLSERQAVAVELAGATAHELNQPLTSILGYAEILRRRVPQGDPNRKPVEVIVRETERMAGIVRKIGQITAYQTKPYVGGSQILDLEQPTGGEDGKSGR